MLQMFDRNDELNNMQLNNNQIILKIPENIKDIKVMYSFLLDLNFFCGKALRHPAAIVFLVVFPAQRAGGLFFAVVCAPVAVCAAGL